MPLFGKLSGSADGANDPNDQQMIRGDTGSADGGNESKAKAKAKAKAIMPRKMYIHGRTPEVLLEFPTAEEIMSSDGFLLPDLEDLRQVVRGHNAYNYWRVEAVNDKYENPEWGDESFSGWDIWDLFLPNFHGKLFKVTAHVRTVLVGQPDRSR